MGTFLGYYGDMTIPETRREEFSRRVLTIWDQGGMMELEEVCMFGKKICLLKPLDIQQDKPAAWIYNYFENDFWEDAGYWPETCRFCTNKVGWRQFNQVCSAVYIFYEFYTDSFGIANQDDSVYDGRRIIGWLNHLFHEQYANDRVRDPWRIYQLLPEYRRDDDLLALIPSGNSVDVIGAVTYLVAAGRDEWREWRKEQSSDHSPADGFSLFDCITVAENILAELKKSGDGDEAQKLERLKTVLKSEKPGYRQEELPDHYRAFSLTASMLPMEITAKLLARMAERYQDDPGGAEKLRRYLAVLGNLELRKAELGF